MARTNSPAIESKLMATSTASGTNDSIFHGKTIFPLNELDIETDASIFDEGNLSDVQFGRATVGYEYLLSPSTHAFLATLYSATTALSVMGNILVIVVFSTCSRRSPKSDLSCFLVNLAVADLLMAVFCMPFTFTKTLLGRWIFSAPMCPVVLFIQTLSVTASVGTITAIGVDRYWAVVHPIRSKTTRPRSRTAIAAIWFISGMMSSVQLIVGKTVTFDDGVTDCVEDWPNPKEVWRRTYTLLILVFTYLLPLSVISMTYGFVGCRLWRRKAPGNADGVRDLNQLRSKRKTIKMLVVVVALFGLCWLPLHAFTLAMDFLPQSSDAENGTEGRRTGSGSDVDEEDRATTSQIHLLIIIYCAVHWLAMSNSFVNPLIYGLLNDSFRDDLKWLLHCRRIRPPPGQQSSATATAGSAVTTTGNSLSVGVNLVRCATTYESVCGEDDKGPGSSLIGSVDQTRRDIRCLDPCKQFVAESQFL